MHTQSWICEYCISPLKRIPYLELMLFDFCSLIQFSCTIVFVGNIARLALEDKESVDSIIYWEST